jgi:GNAT superfamily N-acetyltransferase
MVMKPKKKTQKFNQAKEAKSIQGGNSKIRVRKATSRDVEKLFSIGMSDSAFSVSPRIPFYEKGELAYWISRSRDNLLLVVEMNGSIIGFTYAKLMSWHWALIDNFYILPSFRKEGVGKILWNACIQNLRSKGIKYVSTIVRRKDTIAIAFLQSLGCKVCGDYVWTERFIEE